MFPVDEVRLRFSTESNIESLVIRWFTHSSWSHVDFVMPNGKLLGARLKGGVELRPPGYARFSRSVDATITTPIAAQIYEFALDQIGKPYDWKAIVGFAIDRNWEDNSSWFCSELVAAACKKCGLIIVNSCANVDRITPGDLALSPVMQFQSVKNLT